MPDFEKSNELLAEVWKLPDAQYPVLFEYISNYLYGNKEFNEAVKKALDKMKVKTEGEKMNPETLEKAIAEAKRFITIAEQVEIQESYPLPDRKPYRFIQEKSPKNSACKRASLDLTRALARMRDTRP